MLNQIRLGANYLLLLCDVHLLLDLRLDHLNQELLVVRVHSTSSIAASARIRPSLLCLATIAAEARNRLHR